MSKLFEETIAKVRELSAEEQSMLAELLSSAGITGTYDASPEEMAGIERGLSDARAGRFATSEQVEAVFAKYRK